jgi:uncharacterized glyoxalase superfamily protein PhnB
MAVQPVPEGYHSITPYLVVPGVATLLDFLQQAFEAQELHRVLRPDGTIMPAEVRIGDSRVMLGEPMGDAQPLLGALYLYVHDVDAVYTRALPADQFYGDRSAGLKDPIGNPWWIATHQEDVPPEEIARRAEAGRQQHWGSSRFRPSVCLTERAARHQAGAAGGIAVAWSTGTLLRAFHRLPEVSQPTWDPSLPVGHASRSSPSEPTRTRRRLHKGGQHARRD